VLGTSIRASNGETPTDFIAAMYAGGSSMAIVGASDFTPDTSPTRLLFLLNSLIGMSVMSLTLTYVMQVYTALQRQRNGHEHSFPLGMHGGTPPRCWHVSDLGGSSAVATRTSRNSASR
jgi:hypothetical protein